MLNNFKKHFNENTMGYTEKGHVEEVFVNLAYMIDDIGNCKEKDVAFQKLIECKYWFIKAIENSENE